MAQNPIHVTISDDATIEFVRGKVSSGEYASETDVVRESLEALRHDAVELERWEREVVVPAYDRLMANPASAVSLEELQRGLEAKRRVRLKAS